MQHRLHVRSCKCAITLNLILNLGAGSARLPSGGRLVENFIGISYYRHLLSVVCFKLILSRYCGCWTPCKVLDLYKIPSESAPNFPRFFASFLRAPSPFCVRFFVFRCYHQGFYAGHIRALQRRVVGTECRHVIYDRKTRKLRVVCLGNDWGLVGSIFLSYSFEFPVACNM